MTMKETASIMLDKDYKKRFVAEYWQTKNRYEALHTMTIKYEAGTLGFTPNTPLGLLNEQKALMYNYLRCLEIRAELEKIDLRECATMMNAIEC